MPVNKLNVKAKVIYKALNGFDYTITDSYNHQRLIRDETEKLNYQKAGIPTELNEPLVGKS